MASWVETGRIEALQYRRRLAGSQRIKAKYSESKASLLRIVDEATAVFGDGSAKTAEWYHTCAMLMHDLGYRREAIELQRKVISDVGSSAQHHNLRFFLGSTLDPQHAEEAANAARKSWEIAAAERGNNHPFTLSSGISYAKALCLVGDMSRGVQIFNELQPLSDGGSSPHQASALNLLAGEAGRNSVLFDNILDDAAAKLDTNAELGLTTAEHATRSVLIDRMASPEHLDKAIRLAERLAEFRNGPRGETLGDKVHWYDLDLGIARYRQERYSEAERSLKKALRSKKESLRALALTFAAMTSFRKGDAKLAAERIDELGLFSVLRTELPQSFQFAYRENAYMALLAQRELRELDPKSPSLLTSESSRIDLGLKRQARHVDRHPEDLRSGTELGSFYVWFGRNEKHHELCHVLLERADQCDDVEQQASVALSVLVHPSIQTEQTKRARDLIDHVVASVKTDKLIDGDARKLGNYQSILALAEMRLGNFEEANVWLDKTEPIVSLPNRGRWAVVKAIYHARRGQPDEAKAALDIVEEVNSPPPSRTVLSMELVDRRNSNVHEWLLYEEAAHLVQRTR